MALPSALWCSKPRDRSVLLPICCTHVHVLLAHSAIKDFPRWMVWLSARGTRAGGAVFPMLEEGSSERCWLCVQLLPCAFGTSLP